MYNLSQHLPLKLFLSNTSHVMTSFSGKRFKYTPWDRSYNHIYESIEALDRKGMDVIEKLDPQGFSEYLKEYGNTICGRHPIGVLLNVSTMMLA